MWVGYSSGIIRVFDLAHFTHFEHTEKWQFKVRKDASPFPILATLQEHKGGVYAITSPPGSSSSELVFRSAALPYLPRLHLQPKSREFTCHRARSCSNDFTVRAWTKQYQHVQMYDGHSNWVRSLCVFGSMMASASEDHVIRVWDIQTAQTVAALIGHTSGVWIVVEVCALRCAALPAPVVNAHESHA